MFETESSEKPKSRAAIPISDIDRALTAQIVVAWAGETGEEEKRLGWWRSDLVSEYGGKDLFRRLLPSTWPWAVLQCAREVARRKDAELRRQDHDPDSIVSLYSLGFELDERLEERLQDLKRSGQAPEAALPDLGDGIQVAWNPERFCDWLRGHGDADTVTTPVGRHIKGEQPASFDRLVRQLVGALLPLADSYPLPHYRRTK